MKLHNIKAKNFLSLSNCIIDNLDPHLNFLVGPNGSGKTTIFRLLRVIRDILDPTDINEKIAILDQLCTRGVFPREIDISINIEFDTHWEQEVIIAFLCSSLSQPDNINPYISKMSPENIRQDRVSIESYIPLIEWLMQGLRPESVSYLFRGDLRLTYRGLDQSYQLSYTFICRGEPITIVLSAFFYCEGGTFCRGNPPEKIESGPNGTELLFLFLETIHEQEIKKDFNVAIELFGEQRKEILEPFDAEEFFLFLSDQRGHLVLRDQSGPYAYSPPYSTFISVSGEHLHSYYGRRGIFQFERLISLLLKRALAFTNNVRLPISKPIKLDLNEAFLPLDDFEYELSIPIWLFRLKNGTLEERLRFQRIQRSFTKLMGGSQSFDLVLKLLPERKVPSQEAQTPFLDLRVTDTEGETSLLYQGTGAWEALVLSTILDEGEGRIVLLDEPAANLHPGMQRKLLEVLHGAPGQMIVVTHSAHLLPTHAREFRLVRRIEKNQMGTQIMGLGNHNLVSPDKLEKKLHVSSDIPGLLFSNGVILVEGATELGALSEWFPASTASSGRTFADLNIVIYALQGKDDIPFFLRFLIAFGVPWAVIYDGDALPPNKYNNRLIWEALKDLDIITSVPLADSPFIILKAFAEEAGLYTANASEGDFETIPAVARYLAKNSRFPKGKSVLKGRAIAQDVCLSEVPEIDKVLHKILKRLMDRTE